MSIYPLHKTAIKNTDKVRTFFWQGGSTKRKYHLVRWSKICKAKKKGGLGVKDLRKMNVSLLWKWWWKLEHETGIWQRLVAAKYVHGKPIGTIKHRLDDSPIWSDLLKIRGFYMAGRKVEVKNRKQTLFSHDVWLYDMPVKEKFSELYNLCEQNEITVAEVLSTSMQLSFRRWLTPDLRERWGC
jgi:hypothetical protein